MWASVQHVLVAQLSKNGSQHSVSVLSACLSLYLLHAGQPKTLVETADRQHAEKAKSDDKSIKCERKERKDCHLMGMMVMTSGKHDVLEYWVQYK